MTTQKLTGQHVADLLACRTSAVVEHADGTWEVLRDLDDRFTAASLEDTSTVLRYPGRQWAQEIIDAKREELEEAGKPTAKRSLQAAAAKEATAELHAEAALIAALPLVPVRKPKHRAEPAAPVVILSRLPLAS